MSVQNPVLIVTQIQDAYTRQNFINLAKYFTDLANSEATTPVVTTSTADTTPVVAFKKITQSKYQVLSTDKFIAVDTTNGPATVVLPLSSSVTNFDVTVQKISSDSNAVTVQPSNPGPELIRGLKNVSFSSQWNKQHFYAVSPAWYY